MVVDRHKKQSHNLLRGVLGTKCLLTIGIIEFHNNCFTTSYSYSNTFALLLNLKFKGKFQNLFLVWFVSHS